MKAMILERFGGTERFAVATVPAPVPKRGEVLVTIKAAGVNPIDVKTRRGGGIADSLRRQRPMILGWDLSGVVSKTGEGVEEFRIGDPVFGTVNFPGPGCAYAEFAAVPAEHLALNLLDLCKRIAPLPELCHTHARTAQGAEQGKKKQNICGKIHAFSEKGSVPAGMFLRAQEREVPP